jgi:hypothetical protein
MPGNASSNASRIAEKLRALADSIRFDGGTVGDKGLGRDLAAAVAVGIAGRSLGDQADPGGQGWPENRGKYGVKKRGQGLPVGVGIKGKRSIGRPMLSLVELAGEVTIEDDGRRLIIKYGTSDDVRRKGNWFTGGSSGADGCEPSGAKNQKPRKFFGLDDTIRAELRSIAHEHFAGLVRRFRGL